MKSYEAITNEIISKLKEGTIPWRQTWRSGLPSNFVSKQPYKGINIWLLWSHEFRSNYWITFNQAKQLSAYINKGEHGRAIVFWKILEMENEEGDIDKIPLLRTYTVFNIEQTSIKFENEPLNFDPILKAQEIVNSYKDTPAIEPGEPSYSPQNDMVYMPPMSSFETPSYYYSTLFHELSHSTGHSSRLNRLKKTQYGSDPYAEEEIIAEMSSAYLSGIAGTDVYAKIIDNSIAYIQHWIERFQNNDRLIISLASQAQKASDWILGNRNDPKEEISKEEI